MKHKCIFIFLLVLNVFSCKQQELEKLDRKGFSISYPSYLNLEESGEGMVFALLTKQQGESDSFIENINLVEKDVGNVLLQDFILETKPAIKNVASIIEDRDLIIKGENCHRLIFELTENGVQLKFIQHYYVKNEKAYVLTYSSELKEFDKSYPDMNNVLMSFKIK